MVITVKVIKWKINLRFYQDLLHLFHFLCVVFNFIDCVGVLSSDTFKFHFCFLLCSSWCWFSRVNEFNTGNLWYELSFKFNCCLFCSLFFYIKSKNTCQPLRVCYVKYCFCLVHTFALRWLRFPCNWHSHKLPIWNK